MEADLMNLVPAIGEINGNRSNYSFLTLEGEASVYGVRHSIAM
jgi:deoxyribonuclease-1